MFGDFHRRVCCMFWTKWGREQMIFNENGEDLVETILVWIESRIVTKLTAETSEDHEYEWTTDFNNLEMQLWSYDLGNCTLDSIYFLSLYLWLLFMNIMCFGRLRRRIIWRRQIKPTSGFCSNCACETELLKLTFKNILRSLICNYIMLLRILDSYREI